MRIGAAWALFTAVAAAQGFTQRGFLESGYTAFPQTAPNDSGRFVAEALLRYEASWQAAPWLKVNGSVDARTDSHRQTAREFDFSFDDRTIRRPAFALRRLSAIANKGKFTVELGRQFIRWGRVDILNPEDRFAPKDFLNVVNSDFLGVTAARVTYESGADTLDAVWQPWFTPSRTPLWNQRWTVPPGPLPIRDLGAEYPARHQFGLRWNHVGRGFELGASYFDGFNHLPLARATGFDVERYYPRLRLYGADAAVPTRWVTIKTEAAYFTAPLNQTDEYLLYVVQLERQQGNWIFVGGYSGEVVTKAIGNPLAFSPERGFARSAMGRAEYTIGPTRSVAATGVARQNGAGTWLRGEYSQMVGRHWRVTGGVTWIRGDGADFLGEYHRNSYASVALRYSF
ncbi:MAG: hypothetical protein JSU00_16085 [Acidobacteria bacterium]|nr:hypothetical protein [Acidobacteriota bacterium]